MPTVVQFTAPQHVELVEVSAETLEPGHFRVSTWYSGISTGTELTAFRGSNPYLTKSWDPRRRLFTAGEPSTSYPIQGWGYSEVGEVVEVADDVTGVTVGELIAGVWGHRSEAIITAATPNWARVPDGVDPVRGVFARVGAIALNSVLAADTRLGETVAVFGQGVIGLLATQLATLSGVSVVAIDAHEHRLKVARLLGAQHTIPADIDGGAGATIRAMVGDQGADSAIELSGSYRALHEAVRCVGVDGNVVASGFYQGDASGLRLGDEFHHNRVRITSSQIGGTPLQLGPRWTQRRLLRVFLTQLAAERVSVAPLLTDIVDAAAVSEAFQVLDQGAPETLQVVLRFNAPTD